METKNKSFVDKWRNKYLWFNALMFILVGDNEIIFKTPEQIARSTKKIKKQNPAKSVGEPVKPRSKSGMSIRRYY